MAAKRDKIRGLGPRRIGRLVMAVGLGLAGSAGADEDIPQAKIAQAEFTIQAQALDLELIAEEEAVEDDADLLNIQPGFQFNTNEDLAKQVSAFTGQLDAKDWGKAFRLLTDLSSDQLNVMVPIGDDGLHMGVQVQVQNRLLTMPPDGQRAFQLYFDGQAREMLDEVREHPRPGSEEQLVLARKLVDRLLASSVGAQAADLLGDLYFERGQFAQARRCWKLAMQRGSASGQDELQLQTKIVMAMQRSGEADAAADLYGQLRDRYGKAKVTLAGQSVDAVAMLGQMLGQAQQHADTNDAADDSPLTLPKPGTPVTWHRTFWSDATRIMSTEQNNNQRHYYYRGIQDLTYIVPQVVADDEQVYFQWVGTVFALDRATGKINWVRDSVDSVKETGKTLADRMNANAGDPKNYQIALADHTVLVTDASRDENYSQFTLKAYDKQTGGKTWHSKFHRDWGLTDDPLAQNDTSVAGQVLVVGGMAYAIVHRASGSDCYLRRFNPKTGVVDWTLSLGAADALSFQYTNIRRMPQPRLLMGDGLLYVMMNNGSLIAVDVAGTEIAWARRLSAPLGVGMISNRNGQFNARAFETMANPNGAGEIILDGQTLYAKEHMSKQLVAVDPFTGQLKWSVDSIDPDAKLVGVDDERFYVMNQALKSYYLKDDQRLDRNNDNDTGQPKHAGALLIGDQLLAITVNPNEASGRLRLFDTEHLDTQATYELGDYFDPLGGRLYRFDDLLICIDQSQITAIKLDTSDTP